MTLKKILISSLCAANAIFAATVLQNQVGFLTNGIKQIAVVEGAGQTLTLKDGEGTVVFTTDIPEAMPWVPSSKDASLIDFSEVTTAGTYRVFIGEEEVGHPIIISDNAFESVTKGSLKFFYFQRASTALEEEYAGIYARAKGHPDTSVKYHQSTGHDIHLNETFSAPKGWYDAGDYGKYIVNSGITTYTLLQLYQQNKTYFDTLDLNIPESGNTVPDLLDEIRWNLDWMMAMQDKDGGVFHKLTTKQFAGMVMPEKTKSQRYAIGKGIEASLNFAAVMALAADIYAPFDAKFADSCAKASARARIWAYENPYEFYEQPSDVGTGSYTGYSAWSGKIWTNAELYRITGDQSLVDSLHALKNNKAKPSLQSWTNSLMLEAFTIATNPKIFDKNDVDTAKVFIFTLADEYVAALENNGFGVPLTKSDFNWGSNSVAANKGMVLIHAYILSQDEKYLNAAVGIADYILGRNPLDISYLTGYGVNQVMHPHHRPSQADGIEAPVPGMVAGGPNRGANDAGSCGVNYAKDKAAAEAYYDNVCSYASNEVAINWNAPFAYLVGSIQAIYATGKTYDTSSTASKATYKLDLIPGPPKSKAEADTTEKTDAIVKDVQMNPVKAGHRLVTKGNKVLLEKTTIDGTVKFFNLRGKKVR